MSGGTVAVIGGGPAGLMAAEVISAKGLRVAVYERMPTVGRKFLIAGRGGLNLTHSEPFPDFIARYGAAAAHLNPMLEAFPPAALIAWANGLGQETFIGSSGRVFPKAMKASPLLRSWLARLVSQNVTIHTRHQWLGWDQSGAMRFRRAGGEEIAARADAMVLALGGASWPRLGSDGGWVDILRRKGVEINVFKPANCGFSIQWSEVFRSRFGGTPLKNVTLTFGHHRARGEAIITAYGIEGGAVYALSAPLRDAIAAKGSAQLIIDLRPNVDANELAQKLSKPRGKQSIANYLRKSANLSALEINLLRESHADLSADAAAFAARIKSLPLAITGTQGLARAISTAGGMAFSAVDENLMLRALPGVFAAGEMLDWEAPTGGYLLQASLATGAAAARGVLHRLSS